MYKKTKMLWVANLVLMLTLALLVGIVLHRESVAKNCKPTKEQAIRHAIEAELFTYPPRVEFNEKEGRYKPTHPIFYEGVDDFLTQNPDCCSAIPNKATSKDPNGHDVIVRYKVFFLDTKGDKKSLMKQVYRDVPACGWKDLNQRRVRPFGFGYVL